MGQAIGESLGFAVGIAVSPVPIAAVILMLFSARAGANSTAFAVGWVVGIVAVTTLALLVPGLENDNGTPSDTTGWIKLGLGVLLLVAGARQWRRRPADGAEPEAPRWMDRIDSMAPPAAAGLGAVLSGINPKNLLLAAAGGATIGSLGLSTGEAVGTVAAFTVIAASTVLVPVIGSLLAGERLAPTLDRSKDWLVRNNNAVMAVLFVVFAAKLVGDGISILSA